MASSFVYWNDCTDEKDMDAMWRIPEVSKEWLNAGESPGEKVHLSRDPDGNLYLTQVEMMAAAEIVIKRDFNSKIRPEMICSIAELESNRQPFVTKHDKKTKQCFHGLMQMSSTTAEWLARDEGYQKYQIEENSEILYRPFASVYFGAAHLSWLSNFEQKERDEEFIVRSYNGGTKKANRKSTLQYWRRYISVKANLPCRFMNEQIPPPLINDASALAAAVASHSSGALVTPVFRNEHWCDSQAQGVQYTYWDCRASPEDMQAMWSNPDVAKEWAKSGEKPGKVRFSHDKDQKPYLSHAELKAVAAIILSRHFSDGAVRSSVLCAVAEMVSMRFVNGVRGLTGLMGIDYSKAYWLYMELGYRSYKVESPDDLTKPFVSMYFGAAYLLWLSQYEGRERTPEFVIQAYIAGPPNVSLENASPIWLRFEQTLSDYEEVKRGEAGSCRIL